MDVTDIALYEGLLRSHVRYLFSQRTVYGNTNLCFREHSDRKSWYCVVVCEEIIAVCSQIHTKHINTLCGQNVECRTYRAVNTLRLSYRNQPVNAVQ